MKGVLGNDDGWSILFALTVIPGIFQVPKQNLNGTYEGYYFKQTGMEYFDFLIH